MVGAIILRVREPELRPYKPMICVPVMFALAAVLIGLWLVGLGLYSARRQWIGKGEAESSEQ
ncbi:Y+L amino acid transporter [Aspergillus tubingensis]|nr:Y+L amino acid transporter [Aspergillus tubingensis]GLB14554.1 Y+L amino acid transporter [Aspergillus tubingensis]